MATTLVYGSKDARSSISLIMLTILPILDGVERDFADRLRTYNLHQSQSKVLRLQLRPRVSNCSAIKYFVAA